MMTGSVSAQSYPSHPIRLVSPNPAGGANDTIARIVINKLSEILGVQIVIDNRGGGGGLIGGEIAAHASPDGYTLLAGSVSTHSFAPIIHPKARLRSGARFRADLVICDRTESACRYSVCARGERERIDRTRQIQAGDAELCLGRDRVYEPLCGCFVRECGGHQPGNGACSVQRGRAAITATIAGETQFYFGPMAGGTVPHVKAGRLKALAVGGAKRSPVLPEVPTVAESGLPAYKSSGWFGLLRQPERRQHSLHVSTRRLLQRSLHLTSSQRFFDIAVEPGRATRLQNLRASWSIKFAITGNSSQKLGMKFD